MGHQYRRRHRFRIPILCWLPTMMMTTTVWLQLLLVLHQQQQLISFAFMPKLLDVRSRRSSPFSSFQFQRRHPLHSNSNHHHDNHREGTRNDSEDNNNNNNIQRNKKNDDIESPSSPPPPFRNLNILLVDHYDSFTYNIVNLVNEQLLLLLGQQHTVTVVQAQVDNDELLHTIWDGIILSPGPGHARDQHVAQRLVREYPQVPILGVCLGHQVLGYVYNNNICNTTNTDNNNSGDSVVVHSEQEESESIIRQLATPVHGQVHTVQVIVETTTPTRQTRRPSLWEGIPNEMNVTRYHSWYVVDTTQNNNNNNNCNNENNHKSLGEDLIATAVYRDDDDTTNAIINMALEHREFPHFGVQFHPESIGTDPHLGTRLVKNFLHICQYYQQQQQENQNEQDNYAPMEEEETANQQRRILNPKTSAAATTSSASSLSTPPTVYIHKVPALSQSSSTTTKSPTPNQVFEHLFSTIAKSEDERRYSYWLDHNSNDNDNRQADGSVVSIMGVGATHRVEYYGPEHKNTNKSTGVYEFHHHPDDDDDDDGGSSSKDDTMIYHNATIMDWMDRQQASTTHQFVLVEDFLLPSDLDDDDDDDERIPRTSLVPDDALDFGFRGGWVGYLGYEVRHDTTPSPPSDAAAGTTAATADNIPTIVNPHVPTAAWLRADRSLVYHHENCEWFLVGVEHHHHHPTNANGDDDGSGSGREQIFDWMQTTVAELQSLATATATSTTNSPDSHTYPHNEANLAPRRRPITASAFIPRQSRRQYDVSLDNCIEHIRQGESYELCMTNALECRLSGENLDALQLYQSLRQTNPAPFSAFLHWNLQDNPTPGTATAKRSTTSRDRTAKSTDTPASLAICCSSPERFISVQPKRKRDDGGSNTSKSTDQKLGTGRPFVVQAKPIKGTIARVMPANGHSRTLEEQWADDQRAQHLEASVKDRAENLMIVDLLRHDLNRVCQTGSVHVPKLMQIESFETVHQMVSTIEGTIGGSSPPDQQHAATTNTAVDVLRACFPGGSMTGAPKRRTMELLHELEHNYARGPYSGCLGYLSWNGAIELNIVIRAAVVTPVPVEPSGTRQKSQNVEGVKRQWNVSVGAGGAITILSEKDSEYEEMMLKARAVTNAIGRCGWNADDDNDEDTASTATIRNVSWKRANNSTLVTAGS